MEHYNGNTIMLSKEQLETKSTRELNKVLCSMKGGDQSDAIISQISLIEGIIRGRSEENVPERRPKLTRADLPDTIISELELAELYVFISKGALRRGIPFELTFAQMKFIISRKKCAYTGIKFIPASSKYKPTFERKDASKGYTMDNVILVCNFANKLKNELLENPEGDFLMTPTQLKKFIKEVLGDFI